MRFLIYGRADAPDLKVSFKLFIHLFPNSLFPKMEGQTLLTSRFHSNHSFIHSLIYLFIYTFMYSFINAFIHLFPVMLSRRSSATRGVP